MGATQKPNPCQNSFKKRQKLCGTNEKKKAKYTISCIVKCTCLVWHVCAFTCIFAQATLRCVTICSLLWKIFRKRHLKTNPVEWKIKASYTYLHLWGKQQGFCFSSRWTPRPDTVRQAHRHPHTQTHVYICTHTHIHSSAMKKGKTRRKKTWIPPVVCVLEQVNSLYSRIAITSTLQQGCSWLELNTVWLNQTRGLFFSLFVKMQIWPAPFCKNSYCLQSTFPIFVFTTGK